MHPEIRKGLPEQFPEELLNSAYSLEVLHIRGLAWIDENAIKAIHACAEKRYAILGGDVYEQQHGRFIPTLDSWYLNQGALPWEEYVEESRKKAVSYITMYANRNGKMYYYAPVVAKKKG